MAVVSAIVCVILFIYNMNKDTKFTMFNSLEKMPVHLLMTDRSPFSPAQTWAGLSVTPVFAEFASDTIVHN